MTKNKSKLLLAFLFITSSTFFTAAPNSAYAKEFCSSEEELDSDLLIAAVEDALNELTGTVSQVENDQFDSNQDPEDEREKVMCSVKDGVTNELTCQGGALGDEITSSKIRAVLSCINDGSMKKTGFTYNVKVGADVLIGRFLKLLSFEITLSGPQTEITRSIYSCQNTETGEYYTGSMDEIASEYNRYLKSIRSGGSLFKIFKIEGGTVKKESQNEGGVKLFGIFGGGAKRE